MRINSTSDLKHLSFEEIDQIIHDEHVTANQLNIVAAYFTHLNAIKQEEIKTLEQHLARVQSKLEVLQNN